MHFSVLECQFKYRSFNLNYTTDLYCGLNFEHTVGSQICTVGLNFSITGNITTVLCTAVQYGTVQYGTRTVLYDLQRVLLRIRTAVRVQYRYGTGTC
eukprot:COSAG05_NODE_433_length_9859_cov_4.471004_3_plen_97_part_00